MGRLIIAVVAMALILFVIVSSLSGFWPFLHGFAWRTGVEVTQARLLSPDTLALNVGSCHGDPEVVRLRETDVDVQVKVVTSSFPFRGGRDDCSDGTEVQLQEPFGNRILIDTHTGQAVSVRQVNSSSNQGEESPPPEVPPPEIDDPPGEAELQDLQRIANQKGTSLQEAIDQYGWQDNFALLASKISDAFPAAFTRAEILDGGHAWIGFAGSAPEAAFEIIDLFRSSHSGVLIEIRADIDFTEAELQMAIPAAHYAVYESPEVRDATTSFDYATGQITTIVILESTASDSVLNDLQVAGTKAIADAIGAGILDSITYSVIRSDSESLGGLD